MGQAQASGRATGPWARSHGSLEGRACMRGGHLSLVSPDQVTTVQYRRLSCHNMIRVGRGGDTLEMSLVVRRRVLISIPARALPAKLVLPAGSLSFNGRCLSPSPWRAHRAPRECSSYGMLVLCCCVCVCVCCVASCERPLPAAEPVEGERSERARSSDGYVALCCVMLTAAARRRVLGERPQRALQLKLARS